MSSKLFSLVPYHSQHQTNCIVNASFLWNISGNVELWYSIKAGIGISQLDLVIPRTNMLKYDYKKESNHTYFQALFSLPNKDKTWELNISPLGESSLLSYVDYKYHSIAQHKYFSPITKISNDVRNLSCNVKFDLKSFLPLDTPPLFSLAVGLVQKHSAPLFLVIPQSNSSFSYSDPPNLSLI